MRISGKEAHVGPPHPVVGVANRRKHPLGEGLPLPIGAEEVVENGCIKRPDCLLAIVVVVGLDLRAFVVMATASHGRYEVRVFLGERTQRHVLGLQARKFHRGNVPIELFFLIADLMLFYYD